MNNKVIGLFAILCSPFLAIDLIINGSFDSYHPTSLGGLFSFIYMTGWLVSVLFLFRMHRETKTKTKTVLIIQIIFLCLAEIWNIWSVIEPGSTHFIFRLLDLFWPVSNCCMLVTGITIILAKKIRGWQGFIPFIAGLWLPASFLTIMVFGKIAASTYIICAYSIIAWSLLGLSVYTNNRQVDSINSITTQSV